MHLAFGPSRQVIEVANIFSALRAHHKPTFYIEIIRLFYGGLPGNVTTPFPRGVAALFASGSGMKSSSDWL